MVDFKKAHAFVVAPVEVFGRRNARLHRCLGKGFEHLPAQALFIHAPLAPGVVVAQQRAVRGITVLHQRRCGAARAVQSVGTSVVVFVELEVRQAIVPAPLRRAGHIGPAGVITGLAAHINHAVDAATAAQRFSARVDQAAAIEPGFGLGFEQPIGARVADAIQIAHRDMNPVVIVAPTGFNQ